MKPYYEDDFVTLYHGDCREVLPDVTPRVLVTDPPFGIAHRTSSRGDAAWRNADQAITGDEDTSLRDWVLDWHGAGPALVFGSWKAPKPAGVRSVLIWDKGMSCGMGDLSIPWKPNTEEIYVLGTGFVGHRGSSVLSHGIVGQVSWGRVHPNEKPVKLMRELVAKCPPDCVVVDPFAGSGSTLRAAKDLGRAAVGCEIEERYCEVIAQRLAQEILFGEAA